MHSPDIESMPTRQMPTSWLVLKAGPLSVAFDPVTAALRHIRLGSHEIVQEIYVAVRDHIWETVAPHVSGLRVEAEEDGFRLTFDVLCQAEEIKFAWRGEISGDALGTVHFRMTGQAQTTFWKNRIGLCVLHPSDACAGQPCLVETTDGQIASSRFPDLISPHQPFLNVRALAHEIVRGLWAEVRFEGDTFEMEDQRNWTDASFKTYSTPIALRHPVEVQAGTTILQSVTLTLHTGEAVTSPPSPSQDPAAVVAISQFPDTPTITETPVTIRLTKESPLPLPQIGLGVASHNVPLSTREIDQLKALLLSHLRLDLTLSDQDWEAKLNRASEEALALDARLEIALFLSERAKEEMAGLVEVLELWKPPVLRWLVFRSGEKTTSEEIVQTARRRLHAATPDAQIGGGTNHYFAELNRERPSGDTLDCICYSMNPQVHTFDTPSLMENLPGQAETVRSARAFWPKLPIVVSPVTLKPRFNPDAGAERATAESADTLPSAVDARQCSPVGAAWTLGSLITLCASGAHSVTYYETTGWRGVMETQAGTPLPDLFPSVPGELFPIYTVFADIGEFKGGLASPLESSAPQRVAGMVFQSGHRRALLCANLTAEPQQVQFACRSTVTHLRVRQRDTDVPKPPLRNPEQQPSVGFGSDIPVKEGLAELELPAYAYVRLDWKE